MDTAVIKKEAIDGYAAFGAMDAEGAMRDISDDVEWVVSGNSSLTGTYHGKDEVGTHTTIRSTSSGILRPSTTSIRRIIRGSVIRRWRSSLSVEVFIASGNRQT